MNVFVCSITSNIVNAVLSNLISVLSDDISEMYNCSRFDPICLLKKLKYVLYCP